MTSRTVSSFASEVTEVLVFTDPREIDLVDVRIITFRFVKKKRFLCKIGPIMCFEL